MKTCVSRYDTPFMHVVLLHSHLQSEEENNIMGIFILVHAYSYSTVNFDFN